MPSQKKQPVLTPPRKRGRPRKGTVTPHIVAAPPVVNFDELPPLYKCTKCGAMTQNPVGKFYMVANLEAFDGNDHYSNLCNKCANEYFSLFTHRYGDEKFALLLVCALVGHYFSEPLYEKIISTSEGAFNIGNYFKYLNGQQYKGKNFTAYLLELQHDGKAFKPMNELHQIQEGSWKVGDLRNKNYVLQAIGYDCFEDPNYNDEDRKFLYNTVAGYLTEDVVEDPHKVQAVIGMVKTLWQIERITVLMNKMLYSVAPDGAALSKLTLAKNSLQSNLNTTAKENGISAVSSGRSNKKNTALTWMMKDMLDNGYDEAKANVVDAKLTEAYQTVAAVSAKALFNELNFTGDEYAKMLADQSEVVRRLEKEKIIDQETIRLLRVDLENLEEAYQIKISRTAVPVEGETS